MRHATCAVVLGLVGAVLAGQAGAEVCKGKVALEPMDEPGPRLVLERAFVAPLPGPKANRGELLAYTATREGKPYTVLVEMWPQSSTTWSVREGRAAISDMKMRPAPRARFPEGGGRIMTWGETLATDWRAVCL
ncbi:hypothetical protein [Methylobacterium nodulans]|uniref:Uncharacterized protein n=1 Tax=Methylobacterium nodulans (strain LMG 21967 / CNCM I-2342 / ORS 2060) TaxID=460265 RepID=B8IXY0_METNO|nr:hypothetical protein [Methylobacterium nodulans]ACL63270.1 hypothetical protein Mnod_8815 [Methylobacterium nodulans ORS 2060]